MFIISPIQAAYSLKDSFDWGRFRIYIEIEENDFATRSVREYENGYLTRYDHVHWDDQFGTLPDFKMGEIWREHWGEPELIDRGLFEQKWQQSKLSAPWTLRNKSPDISCPWLK